MRHAFSIVVGLCVLVWALPADAQNCRKTFVNRLNAKQNFTVSSTAVQVLAPNTSRCGAIISNVSANDMQCTDVAADGPPTATTGVTVQAGKTLVLTLEGQGAWQCIRSGASDAIANVAESLP